MNLLRPTFIALSAVAILAATDVSAATSAAGGTAAAPAGGAGNANMASPSSGTSSAVSGGDALSGASRGDVPPIGPAAVDANGVNVNGFGTGIQPPAGSSINGNASSGAAAAITAPSASLTPPATTTSGTPTLSSDIGTGVIIPSYGVDLGGVTPNAYGANVSSTSTGAASAGAAPSASGAVVASGIATPQVNAAERREARKERAVARQGGQMLYSITPRSNVDRSGEVPDDPVSPAISPPDRALVRY
jgi:hypothetical protein